VRKLSGGSNLPGARSWQSWVRSGRAGCGKARYRREAFEDVELLGGTIEVWHGAVRRCEARHGDARHRRGARESVRTLSGTNHGVARLVPAWSGFGMAECGLVVLG